MGVGLIVRGVGRDMPSNCTYTQTYLIVLILISLFSLFNASFFDDVIAHKTFFLFHSQGRRGGRQIPPPSVQVVSTMREH